MLENATSPTALYTFTATDQDIGQAGVVVMSAIGDVIGDVLNVTSNGQLTLVSALDRETTSSYNITIKATDSAPSPFELTASQNITVMVTDVNDNAPTFVVSEMNVTVKEDAPIGSSLFNVTATDLDEGDNARLVYSIASNTDLSGIFRLNATSGQITLNSKYIDVRAIGYDIFATYHCTLF